MFRHMKAILLPLALMLTLGGFSAQRAGAVSYFWQENENTLKENKEVTGSLSSLSFKIRSSLSGGAKFVVTCTRASLAKGAVIFNGPSRLGSNVGRWQVELDLEGCSSTVCTEVVGGKIKVPLTGNSDGAIVSDGKTEPEVTKLYMSFFPLGTEFTKFTLKEGTCGTTGVEVPITTPFTSHGFGAALEGEGGLPVEVDSGVAEARTEKSEHRLTFSCSGETQTPEKAWNTDYEEIKVGGLKYSTKPACMEGTFLLDLVSQNKFKVL